MTMKPMQIHVGHSSAPTSPALQLIEAINHGSTCALNHVIECLVERAQEEADARKIGRWGTNYLDAQLPGTRLTALHVAAKAYAHYRHDRNQAWVYDQCVKRLLEAGANPFIEALGTVRRREVMGKTTSYLDNGQTVLDVCNGVIPPSLKQWMADNIDDNAFQTFGITASHPTTIARMGKAAA